MKEYVGRVEPHQVISAVAVAKDEVWMRMRGELIKKLEEIDGARFGR